MAFQRQSGDQFDHLADINVTPLVDVMLVLLIIFMVTAPMLHQGISVALPKTATTNIESTLEDPIVLSISRDGRYYINETPVARGLLRGPAARHPAGPEGDAPCCSRPTAASPTAP